MTNVLRAASPERNLKEFISGYFYEIVHTLKLLEKTIIPYYEKLLEKEDLKVAKRCQKKLDKRRLKKDHDFFDFTFDLAESGGDYLNAVEMFFYREKLNWLCSLSQTWEQQCYLLMRQIEKWERKNRSETFTIDEIKTFFEIKGIEIPAKIDELRTLVNTIKHGPGDSANKLLKKYEKYFVDSFNCKLFAIFRTTLDFKTLNITKEEIIKFYEVIKCFWEGLLKRKISLSNNEIMIGK